MDLEDLKRRRTNLTSEQTRILEESFRANPYLTADVKQSLAELTSLTSQKVSKWFDNRRSKERNKIHRGADDPVHDPQELSSSESKHVNDASLASGVGRGGARTQHMPDMSTVNGGDRSSHQNHHHHEPLQANLRPVQANAIPATFASAQVPYSLAGSTPTYQHATPATSLSSSSSVQPSTLSTFDIPISSNSTRSNNDRDASKSHNRVLTTTTTTTTTTTRADPRAHVLHPTIDTSSPLYQHLFGAQANTHPAAMYIQPYQPTAPLANSPSTKPQPSSHQSQVSPLTSPQLRAQFGSLDSGSRHHPRSNSSESSSMASIPSSVSSLSSFSLAGFPNSSSSSLSSSSASSVVSSASNSHRGSVVSFDAKSDRRLVQATPPPAALGELTNVSKLSNAEIAASVGAALKQLLLVVSNEMPRQLTPRNRTAERAADVLSKSVNDRLFAACVQFVDSGQETMLKFALRASKRFMANIMFLVTEELAGAINHAVKLSSMHRLDHVANLLRTHGCYSKRQLEQLRESYPQTFSSVTQMVELLEQLLQQASSGNNTSKNNSTATLNVDLKESVPIVGGGAAIIDNNNRNNNAQTATSSSTTGSNDGGDTNDSAATTTTTTTTTTTIAPSPRTALLTSKTQQFDLARELNNHNSDSSTGSRSDLSYVSSSNLVIPSQFYYGFDTWWMSDSFMRWLWVYAQSVNALLNLYSDVEGVPSKACHPSKHSPRPSRKPDSSKSTLTSTATVERASSSDDSGDLQLPMHRRPFTHFTTTTTTTRTIDGTTTTTTTTSTSSDAQRKQSTSGTDTSDSLNIINNKRRRTLHADSDDQRRASKRAHTERTINVLESTPTSTTIEIQHQLRHSTDTSTSDDGSNNTDSDHSDDDDNSWLYMKHQCSTPATIADADPTGTAPDRVNSRRHTSRPTLSAPPQLVSIAPQDKWIHLSQMLGAVVQDCLTPEEQSIVPLISVDNIVWACPVECLQAWWNQRLDAFLRSRLPKRMKLKNGAEPYCFSIQTHSMFRLIPFV